MKILINLFLFVVICGCAQIEPRETELPSPKILKEQFDSLEYLKEKELLNQAAGDVETRNYNMALMRYFEFVKIYPLSIHFSEAHYGIGISYEGLGKYEEAKSQYLKLTQLKIEGSQDYPARAYYRLSFCYEALGEIEKGIVAAKDAEKMQAYLPVEIGFAELPGRLAALYARIGESELAELYMARAEQGINRVKSIRKNMDLNWLGSSLNQMGTVSFNQLSLDTFSQAVRAFGKSQKYLVRSAELEDSKWSQISKAQILENYNLLLGFIKNQQISHSDLQRGQVETANLQANMAADVLENLEILKSYFSNLTDAENLNKDFFEQLALIEKSTKEVILTKLYLAPLTPEAERFINLKRDYKIENPDVISPPGALVEIPEGVPTELPSKKINSDPNL